MTMIFTFTVPGKPVPHSRRQVPARDGSGRSFNVLTKNSKAYQSLVAACAQRAAMQQHWQPPDPATPLRIVLRGYWPYPKATKVADRQRLAGSYKTTKPDMSNVLKNVEDAISHTGGVAGAGAIAFYDDEVLAEHDMVKRWCHPGEERLEVEVIVLDNHEGDMFG